MKTTNRDRIIAYFLLRLALGVNIFMHGLSRLLAGSSVFEQSMIKEFHDTFLPLWSIHVFGLVLPWAEAVIGLFLILGLLTRTSVVLGSLLMILLTFGVTLKQQWEIAGLQLLYSFVYFALLWVLESNVISLDALLFREKWNRDAAFPWTQQSVD